MNEKSMQGVGVGREFVIVGGWSEFQILYFLYFYIEIELDIQ